MGEDLKTTLSNIPCGLCVYRLAGGKISPVYHNSVFYEIMGYAEEHIRLVEKETSFLGVHPEDLEPLKRSIQGAIRSNGTVQHTYRLWNDSRGEYRWIRLEGSVKDAGDNTKLLYGVYSDVTGQIRTEMELNQATEKMQDIINAIPGGVASYRVEGERFIPTYFSDGVMALSGHSREEYEKMVADNALDIIYEPDRDRVLAAAVTALKSGGVLDVSYRMRHKNGQLIWIHLNGRRMGPLAESTGFYAVFTGMSADTRLFQSMVNETADAIYVIDRENYDLLYVNEARNLFAEGKNCVGQKCYAALHGKNAPCPFCTLKSRKPDGEEHEMLIEGTGRFYSTRFRETDWNGIPAYVKYVRDITETVITRKDKERLEQYFQTVLKNLPGGVAVVRYEDQGNMTPEFLSDGFAAMTGMTLQEAWDLYREDAMAGVHPEDRVYVYQQMNAYIAGGEGHCEIVYRLQKGDGSYLWVKNSLTLIEYEDGERRV